jgi:hypothetical protein
MQKFVDSISDPKSANYRHFLTPAEVGATFGPSQAKVQKVVDYLTSYGLKIRRVGENRLSILADATVAQAQAAFNTSIEEYVPIIDGSAIGPTRFSFTTLPNLPTTVSSSVFYIGGLENFTQPKAHASLTPDQLRTLYGLASAYGKNFQGQGRTVGISNFVGYRLSNVSQEYSHFGLPTPSGGVLSNIHVKPINGMNGAQTTENAEGDIDIQSVLAMAPLCTLIIYDDGGDSDLITTLTEEANDDEADIISESYGWSSPDSSFYLAAHNQHLAINAAGITYACASGDSGAGTIDSDPYPGEDPEVLMVGGTTVTTDNAGNRLNEIGWTGSGGGWYVSSDPFNKLPAFQKGTGVPKNIPYRLTPDISLDADPTTGYEIYVQGRLQGWGGTSCAAPTFAGALADCEQQIIAGGGLPKNSLGQQRFGRIQDLLYSFNGDPIVFYDIISGSNGSLPNGGPSYAQVGWDTVTGWGTMIYSGFVAKVLGNTGLAGLDFAPSTVVGGQPVVGTVYLGSFAPSGGVVVNLTSNNKDAPVPASITVPAGSSSASFTVTTPALTSAVTVTVTASSKGVTETTKLLIQPASVSGVSLAHDSVVGGTPTTGGVSLNGPAPTGGLVVSLTSSATAATVPSTVKIPAGATSATFKVTTKPVGSNVIVEVTATHGSTSTSTSFTVEAPSISSIAISPQSITGGKSGVTGKVTLNGPAPTGGAAVALSSSNTLAATVPATAKVAAGATSATFTVTTLPVPTDTTVVIQGVYGNGTQQGSVTLLAPVLTALKVSPTSVTGSSTTRVIGTVTIATAAPKGGLAFTVQSSNTSAASVASSVVIPAGKLSATFTVKHFKVTANTTVQLSTTAGTVTKSASLTVTP